jgi:hypothetical protein
MPSTSTTSNDKAAPGETQYSAGPLKHVLLFDRGRCSPSPRVTRYVMDLAHKHQSAVGARITRSIRRRHARGAKAAPTSVKPARCRCGGRSCLRRRPEFCADGLHALVVGCSDAGDRPRAGCQRLGFRHRRLASLFETTLNASSNWLKRRTKNAAQRH